VTIFKVQPNLANQIFDRFHLFFGILLCFFLSYFNQSFLNTVGMQTSEEDRKLECD